MHLCFLSRNETDAAVQYKALIICTSLHILLLMFELLVCDKLQSGRAQVLWILVFIPLIFMSIISIGICVWAVKHDRTFQVTALLLYPWFYCNVTIIDK